MAGRRTGARCTASEARAGYLATAEEVWERFNAWYDAHPNATFDEMEQELGEAGRALLGEVLALALRRRDLGASVEAPNCERCGQPLVFKGYPEKEVHGLKADVEIPRAYYLCPACESGVFPPRPAIAAAAGQLE